MRHRLAASIVGVTSLIFALSACGNAHLSSQDAQNGVSVGSMAPNPAPSLPHASFISDTPQSVTAPPLSAEQLAEPLATFLSSINGQKGEPWVHVIDAVSGETLVEHNTSTAHTPASTTKILAGLTALHHLDENDTLQTGVAMQGSDLYLWGEGDLLLGLEPSRPTMIDGKASLLDLATQTSTMLKNQGIASVTVHWAPAPFEAPLHLPQWVAQEVTDYEGRVAAYAIDAGLAPSGNTFVTEPEKETAASFVELLKSVGVNASLGSQAEKPAEALTIATVSSATMGEQIRYMLAHSDNTLADQYCRFAAKAAGKPSSYVGATETVAQTLTELQVDTDGLRLEDCSGLSSNNKISPQTLTGILYQAAHSSHPSHKALIRSLPIAGAQGTMTRRSYEGVALGNVQAKTGSLGSVSSLAGIVRTSQGREIIFAIGIDGTDEGAAYFMRPAIDQFVQTIADL